MISRRAVCAGLAAAAAGAGRLGAAPSGFDAVVRKSGGTHGSLGAALADAPASAGPYRILLGRGRWEEKLTVARAGVELVGEDRRGTILTSAVAAGNDKPGGGKWGTFGSATLTVEAPDFTARNLTIENGFDHPAHLRQGGGEGAQAVALALGNAADRSLIDRVDIVGYQDSFYLRGGRALVRGCFVTGHVDFIFGGAAALFDSCEIRSRLRSGEGVQGYIAAPSTPRHQRFGLVFDRCRLTREANVPDGSVYLGRPWRAGGNVELRGAAAYLGCRMDAHIHPDGWASMHYRGPGGYRMTFEPGDARLAEYASTGPGSSGSPRRPILRRPQAAHFTRAALFGNWRPA
ncbi:MAG TPA: pectinesterase family protein [Allosphingosinicella sp.]|jgi:pectinesterase